MDISYLGNNSFRIKAKNGTVVADSTSLIISHKVGGQDFVITRPGEYEVEGISVFGYKANDETNVYVLQCEDVRILYLGDLAKLLSDKIITDLENIDVVIVNLGVLAIKDAIETVSKLEPYYVLPYGEFTPKFIVAYEHGSRSVKSLNLNKVTLPDDLTEVIVFDDKI